MSRILLTCLVLIFCGSTNSIAGFVVDLNVSVSPNNNMFEYSYKLTNDGVSDLPGIFFALDVSTNANLQSIKDPAGWIDSYTIGDIELVWQPNDLSFALFPGNTITFSFDSLLPPNFGEYLVAGLDFSTFETESQQGIIPGPNSSSVPEPSSLLLLGMAMLAIAFAIRLKSSPPHFALPPIAAGHRAASFWRRNARPGAARPPAARLD